MKFAGYLALKLCLCLAAAAAVAAATTPPSLSASPAAVFYQYSSGENQPLPVSVMVSASDGSLPILTTAVTPIAPTPATLFPANGLIVSGGSITVGYDVSTLTQLLSQPGTYLANLTVNAAGFGSLIVPLTFQVGTGTLSIVPTPASLTFNGPPSPAAQTITLASTGNASIPFSMVSNSPWLSVAASTAYTTSTLTVTVNPLNVPNGANQGSITVTPTVGGPVIIPVTLQVGTNTLSATPTSLAFTYTVGGTTPPVQAVQLTSTLSSDTYTAQAISSGDWLLINGATTSVSGTLPAGLNVTVSPTDLAPGNYQGSITATDADANTQTIAVTLVVYSVSGVANPTSLVFVAQAGGPSPASQTVAVNGFGAAATYTATAGGTWLSLSSAGGPAPAQVIVTADPMGLAAGTYAGTVEINLDSHIQTIPVTFMVSSSPVLTTTPGGFIFSYTGGSAPPSPLPLDVSVSSGASQSFTIASGTPSWLQIGPSGALTTTIGLSVTLLPQTLPSGTYLAQIILTPAIGPAVVVPILVTVENGAGVIPNVTSLSFSAVAGGAPISQTVEVLAASSTQFTAATSTTTNNGSWLSVFPASGTAGATNTPLTVTADPTNLTPGTYDGTVTLTTASGVVTQIAVTFIVASPSGAVTISPSTLAFAYTQGGALPATQALQITGSQSFTASATTSTGTWLAVTPSSGTGNASLIVSVTPAGLAPGAYSGSITITPAGGVAQTVAVTLTVSTAGLLAAAPNPLAFTYAVGTSPPAAQTVSVTSTGAPAAFTATAASSSGWLSVTQSATTTPATLTVTANPANLGAGSYSGSIVLSSSSGTAQLNIIVTITVTAALPVIGSVVNAASYLEGGVSPGEIVTIFGTALGPATAVEATIDSQGLIATTLADVTVTFNGYPAPILYASATQINAIVPYELAGTSNVSMESVFGSARSNSVALVVMPSVPGIFSANASGQGPGAILDVNYQLVSASNPVSGGAYIQIFATGQGQTSPGGVDGLIEPRTGPWPVPLLSARVTIGGVPATTLSYVGAAPGLVAGALQIDAVVPDGLPSGPATLVVSFGGVYNSQPGITVAIQ